MANFVLPSEALSGSFVLPPADHDQYPIAQAATAAAFTAYGLIIGNLGLLLPADAAGMVIEDSAPFCELPNAPVGLRGMVNVNGNILPVFDLGMMLGVKDAESGELKMMMIGRGEDAVAVTVSNLPVRVRLNTSQQLIGKPSLPDAIRPFAKGCYKVERLWIDWDAQGFFSSLRDRV